MHHVAFQSFTVNWLKSPHAYIERELTYLHSALTESFEDFNGEMQTRGGSGNRAGPLGKDGLIALAVRRLIWTFNVGRQWHVAQPFKMLVQSAPVMRDKSQRTQTEFTSRRYFGFQLSLAKEHPLPQPHFPAGPNQRFPGVVPHLACQ